MRMLDDIMIGLMIAAYVVLIGIVCCELLSIFVILFSKSTLPMGCLELLRVVNCFQFL